MCLERLSPVCRTEVITEVIQILIPRGLQDMTNTTQCPMWMAASESEQMFQTGSKFL